MKDCMVLKICYFEKKKSRRCIWVLSLNTRYKNSMDWNTSISVHSRILKLLGFLFKLIDIDCYFCHLRFPMHFLGPVLNAFETDFCISLLFIKTSKYYNRRVHLNLFRVSLFIICIYLYIGFLKRFYLENISLLFFI